MHLLNDCSAQAAIILSKGRNHLNDDIFEKLLLLKLNKDFW